MVNLAWHGGMDLQCFNGPCFPWKSSTTWQELNAMLAAKPGTGTTGTTMEVTGTTHWKSYQNISPPPPRPPSSSSSSS